MQNIGTWLAIAGLPLAFGYLYFYGFWNYCLAIALALVCVGMTLRAAPHWELRPTVALAGVLTLTWLTHLVPFVAAAVFLVAVMATGPGDRRSVLMPASTFVPAAILSLAYLLHTDSGDSPTWTNPVGRAIGLISLHTTITSFSRWEDAIAIAIAAVLLWLAWMARRAVPASGAAQAGTAAGVATLAVTSLVLIVPTSFGIDFGLIDERLAVFPVFFGLLWLAARPPHPRSAQRAAVALVVATVALAGVRFSKVSDYDDLADEYLSADRLVDNHSVFVALRFANLGPDAGRNSSWDPTRHLASELAARTHSIDVGHYEAVLDYFTARFREPNLRRGVDPSLTGLDRMPSAAILPAFSSGCRNVVVPHRDGAVLVYTGHAVKMPSDAYMERHRITYVLLIGSSKATGEARRAYEAARRDLACEYERVGATSPTGLVEVWRLKESAAR